MASQLTISLELITFMQWVLTEKSDAFAQFMNESLDASIRAEIARLAADADTAVPSTALYETLSAFIHAMEVHIQQTVGIKKSTSKKAVAQQKSPKNGQRKHAHRCATRVQEASDIASIQSPTQRILYEALFTQDGEKECGVG